jgi:nucleoside 2-deoxyribosyltransferase
MHRGCSPDDAAAIASHATAYYCQHQAFPTTDLLADFHPEKVQVSAACEAGAVREVYLAGPFFDLGQLWMIEQARANLCDAGLRVFSPYHDVGLGSAADVVAKDIEAIEKADVVFAIADGLDAGTIYEIGYARAIGKPVVVYSEREGGGESLKMMEGTGCVMCSNYTTAIYSTLWEAVKL